MDKMIRTFEEMSFNAHPALQTQFYDGWLLRFANGYSNRANSVNMIYPSFIDLETKINECERRYLRQHLASVFKIIEEEHSKIDSILQQRGYEIATPTDLEILDLTAADFKNYNHVAFEAPDEVWIDSWATFEKFSDTTRKNAVDVIKNIQNKSLYISLIQDGDCVACSSSVLENGYAIIGNVVVDEKHRGKGYGRMLCETLLSCLKKEGVHTAYLQVVQTNTPAVKLYAGLGFKKLYSYWYRVKTLS